MAEGVVAVRMSYALRRQLARFREHYGFADEEDAVLAAVMRGLRNF